MCSPLCSMSLYSWSVSSSRSVHPVRLWAMSRPLISRLRVFAACLQFFLLVGENHLNSALVNEFRLFLPCHKSGVSDLYNACLYAAKISKSFVKTRYFASFVR